MELAFLYMVEDGCLERNILILIFFGKISTGNNVIKGANTAVTITIPSGYIVAGNPGKNVESLGDLELKMSKYNSNTK